MKKPRTPPNWETMLLGLPVDQIAGLFGLAGNIRGSKYPHWDQLVHLQPPKDRSHEEWWLALKLQRRSLYRDIPLKDGQRKPFRHLLTDPIPERLHQIDLSSGGRIEMPPEITNPETRDQYYVASLIEEAITSSQLEGAATTRKVAKEMIRSGRSPRDKSERMIYNNYLTMRAISRYKEQPLSPSLVFEIHRSVTDRTLEDPTAAGRFRRDDEDVVVMDHADATVLHSPPPTDQLPDRMDDMCAFANAKQEAGFLHPVLRSIILHFWLAYDHPFVDGNGRTARALFYWSMLRHGYWLTEFITISHIIRQGPAKYSRAFLYTETDDNDLTYFILYHLDVFDRALKALNGYIKRKTAEIQALDARVKGLAAYNHRQRALLSHALRHPAYHYTIYGHQKSHNVVYQTARTDLHDLGDRGLLDAQKVGKRWHFIVPTDLQEKLSG